MMISRECRFGAAVGAFAGLLVGLAGAADWPAWRGPQAHGSVAGPAPPLELAGKQLWKVALPGRGCSTPVVAGGKIFVTSPVDGQDAVIAYDLDGGELWRRTLGELTPGRGQRVGSSANSSPLVAGDRLFAYFKSGTLAALTTDGEELWQVNLPGRFGKDTLWWDQGTSPVMAGGRVVIQVSQTEGDSYLVAFDPANGEVAWKTERKYETGRESGDAYTTPSVVEVDGVETIVTWAADHLTGHRASDGALLWQCGGFNPEKKGAWRVIASAVVDDGLALVPYGRGDFIAGVRLGGKGDVTDGAFAWKQEGIAADSVTPVVDDGRLYLLKDGGRTRGTLTCLEASSGKQLWQERLPRGPQVYYASPIIVGGNFYAAREDGVVFSAKVGKDGLGEVHEHALGEGTIASPVAFDGRLLLRGDKHLICFGDE